MSLQITISTFSIIISFIVIKFAISHCNIINKSIPWVSEIIACTNSSNTCTVNCQTTHACGKENGLQSQGPYIHCPTIASCIDCNINCYANQSCSGSTIYSHECRNLNINIEGTDITGVTIYAPNNGGSLSIVLNDTKATLKQSNIYAGNNTANISINCLNGLQFTSNKIYSLAINGILSFNNNKCISDSSSFYCPNTNQCLINCNGSCKDMFIVAPLGTHTLDFVCGPSANCSGTVLNCNFNINNTTDCSTECTGPCVNPPTVSPISTNFPTMLDINSTAVVINKINNNSLYNVIYNPRIIYIFSIGFFAGTFIYIFVIVIFCFYRYRKINDDKNTLPITNIPEPPKTDIIMNEPISYQCSPKPYKEQPQLQICEGNIIKQNFEKSGSNKNFIDEILQSPKTNHMGNNGTPYALPMVAPLQMQMVPTISSDYVLPSSYTPGVFSNHSTPAMPSSASTPGRAFRSLSTPGAIASISYSASMPSVVALATPVPLSLVSCPAIPHVSNAANQTFATSGGVLPSISTLGELAAIPTSTITSSDIYVNQTKGMSQNIAFQNNNPLIINKKREMDQYQRNCINWENDDDEDSDDESIEDESEDDESSDDESNEEEDDDEDDESDEEDEEISSSNETIDVGNCDSINSDNTMIIYENELNDNKNIKIFNCVSNEYT